MPLKITRPQVHVSPDFMSLVCDMYTHWFELNQSNIERGVRDLSNRRFGAYAMTAKRLLPIVQRQSPEARVSFDYELTRLLGAPFTAFEVIMAPPPYPGDGPQIRWLVGRTKHVQTTLYSSRKWDQQTGRFVGEVKGELGPYNIYIPETVCEYPDLYHFHMIPQRNKRSIDRHYHHYANVTSDGITGHPLTVQTGNCWSEYQSPLKAMLDFPNYPELFRQLYVHLSTFGAQPPRTRLDFDTTTPEH
jgi:hypothetical protein